MVNVQCVIIMICVSIVYATSYGNDLSSSNYYPYSGSYIGANSATQYSNGYSGYTGYGYGNGAGYGNSVYGTGYGSSGYGPSVYNNVILPHPYPVPVPVPSAQTGSRFLVLDDSDQTNGLFGLGGGGIFGFVVLLVFLHYILRTFNVTQTTQG